MLSAVEFTVSLTSRIIDHSLFSGVRKIYVHESRVASSHFAYRPTEIDASRVGRKLNIRTTSVQGCSGKF